MTEQEQKTFDQMREALERAKVWRSIKLHKELFVLEVIEPALTAANAVSHAKPETTPSPEGGAITSESAANAMTSEYSEQPQAQGEAINDVCEVLATVMHFIPPSEPKLMQDVSALCHNFRTHSRPQATEPAGWKLVPVEPTQEMLIALINEWDSVGGRTMYENYRAMLAAAPEAHHE